MKYFIISLLFLFTAMVASAQEVNVRSGEHGSFTRLVFDIPSGTNWNLSTDVSGERASLSLDGENINFLIADVFERINRARISNVAQRPEEPVLDISLACRCSVDAFVLRDTMLVVDVSPRTENDEIVSQILDEGITDTQIARSVFGRVGELPTFPERQAQDLLPGLRFNLNSLQVVEIDESARAQELGAVLAADLATAATEGILDATAQIGVSDSRRSPAKGNELTSSERTTDVLGDMARQLSLGLAGLDNTASDDRTVSIGGRTCVPTNLVNVSDWVDEKLLLDSLSMHRAALYGEFDRLDVEKLESYVRAQIHFGFGAEARATLGLGESDLDPVLTSLSYIIDGEEDPTSVFDRQMDCDGPAALWSVLAKSNLDPNLGVNFRSILSSFEALPDHLRGHLGPKLADRLTAAGHSQVARDVLRRLERMHGEITQELEIRNAELDVLAGDVDGVRTTLHVLATSPGPEAALAIVQAVALAYSEGTRVPEDLVELAAAFALEKRGQSEGEVLWKAYIRALFLNEEYDLAFAELGEPEKGSPASNGEILTELSKALVEKSDDVTFLKHTLEKSLAEQSSIRGDVRLSIASRLHQVGFPTLALTALEKIPGTNLQADLSVEKARAFLSLSRPGEAEIELLGLESKDAKILRALARAKMGDYDYASSTFAALGEADPAIVAAWLGSNWESILEDDENIFFEMARLRQTNQAVDLNPKNVTISEIERLTGASQQARVSLRELLLQTSLEATQ